MVNSRRRSLGFNAGFNNIGANYSTEVQQEIVSLDDGDFKIIPHPDGQGRTMAIRREDTVTVMTIRYVKTGLFKNKNSTETSMTQFNSDGVYQDGRKL